MNLKSLTFLVFLALVSSGCMTSSYVTTYLPEGESEDVVVTRHNTYSLIQLEQSPGPYGRVRYSGMDHRILCPYCLRRYSHESWCTSYYRTRVIHVYPVYDNPRPPHPYYHYRRY